MDKKLILDFDRKQKSSKHKKSHAKESHNKVKQAKVEEEPSIYRDRARERREGLNKDFELDPDDLKISNPIDSAQYDEADQQIDEEERRRQQIEESKYLGGDVEHTHLVKGLDFALLEKVKNDQKLAEKLAGAKQVERDFVLGDPDSDSEEEEFRNEAIIAATSTASSKRQLVDIEKLKKGQSTEVIPCRTALARRILNVLDEKWPDKSDMFLPGRMSYIIPINEDSEESVTTILRSKADASMQEETGTSYETDLALGQLINILAKVRQGKSNPSSSKKQKEWDHVDEMNDYNY